MLGVSHISPVGDGKNQIFVKSLDGYREVQITDEKEGVSTFKWGPTGKGLLCYAVKSVRI